MSYSGEKWGKLDFTDLEIKVLSNDIAYVLGYPHNPEPAHISLFGFSVPITKIEAAAQCLFGCAQKAAASSPRPFGLL